MKHRHIVTAEVGRHRDTAVPVADVPHSRHAAPRSTTSLRPRPRRAWISLIVASVLLGLFVPSALATYGQPNAERLAGSTGEELVVNGSFEARDEGWRSNNAESQPLAWSDVAATGEVSAYLTPTASGTTVIVNDRANTVGSTIAGESYTVTARVRTTEPTLFGHLRIREVQDGQLLNRGTSSFAANDAEWTDVELIYVSETTGAVLDLNVLAWRVPAGQGLLVDDVSMIRTADGSADPAPTTPPSTTTAAPTTTNPPTTTPAPTTTTPAPTTTNPPTTTPAPTTTAPAPPPAPRPPSSGCVNDPLGIPSNGAYLGATVSGNSNVDARERQLGAGMALHRTYYRADQVASAGQVATQDIAEGRLPWVSFKLPDSWTQMANGAQDAWVMSVARTLDAVPGPVWVAFHHEPEHDGDMREWTRMQQHLSPIIRGNTDNVAFTLIMTGWNPFYGGSEFSLDSIWPGDEHVDIIGFDIYNPYGAIDNGQRRTTWVELSRYYDQIAPFAAAHGVEWAVAESGYSNEAAARDPAWLTRAYQDLVARGGIGYSYFDTYRNSIGSWALDTAAKIDQFRALLPQSARLC